MTFGKSEPMSVRRYESGVRRPAGGYSRWMEFVQPRSWQEALAAKADRPAAVPIAGGTDIMVEINFDRRKPEVLLDLGRIDALREWTTSDGHVRLGAAVPYAR